MPQHNHITHHIQFPLENSFFPYFFTPFWIFLRGCPSFGSASIVLHEKNIPAQSERANQHKKLWGSPPLASTSKTNKPCLNFLRKRPQPGFSTLGVHMLSVVSGQIYQVPHLVLPSHGRRTHTSPCLEMAGNFWCGFSLHHMLSFNLMKACHPYFFFPSFSSFIRSLGRKSLFVFFF